MNDTRTSELYAFSVAVERRFADVSEVMRGSGTADLGRLRDVVATFLPRRFTVGAGAVVSSNPKLDPLPKKPILVFDEFTNTPLLHQFSDGLFPIEIVFATVDTAGLLDHEEVAHAVERLAEVGRMAKRGKFYVDYVPVQKPSGKTLMNLREVRVDDPPKTYFVCWDSGWDDPNDLAKAFKDRLADAPEASLDGVLVLRRNWMLFKPAYKKRVDVAVDNALFRWCQKILVDLNTYPMLPADIGRYLRE